MPFRDCSTTKYKSHLKKKKNCLFGDIGLCEAPCQNIETKERYQNNIRMLKEFLRGRKQNVYKNLQKEMKRLSREKRYEEAKIFRDRLNALEHIKDVAIGLSDDVVKPENILFKRIECYDISNISGQFCVGSMIVFINGKPEKSEYRKFKIKGRRLTVNGNEARIVESQTLDVTASRCKFRNRSTLPTNGDSLRSDIQMMEQVLDRRFNNDWAPPDLIIIDGGIAHLNIAKHVLDKYKQDVPILAIAKGPKRRKNEFHFSNQVLAQYFHKNPDLQRIAIRARNEAHRFAVTYYRKLHHKNMLNVT
jgi:excinuclease ABC subunit C